MKRIPEQALREGLTRWVREFDAAQQLAGDERRRAEGLAGARLRGWVMREYPDDSSTHVARAALKAGAA